MGELRVSGPGVVGTRDCGAGQARWVGRQGLAHREESGCDSNGEVKPLGVLKQKMTCLETEWMGSSAEKEGWERRR